MVLVKNYQLVPPRRDFLFQMNIKSTKLLNYNSLINYSKGEHEIKLGMW